MGFDLQDVFTVGAEGLGSFHHDNGLVQRDLDPRILEAFAPVQHVMAVAGDTLKETYQNAVHYVTANQTADLAKDVAPKVTAPEFTNFTAA